MHDTLKNLVDAFVQPVGIVTKSFEYVAANYTARQLMGFDRNDPIEGKIYSDMRCDAANCSTDFMEQDQIVLAEKAPLRFLSVHKYHDGQYHCFIGTKSILLIENTEYVLQSLEELTHLISPLTFEQLLDFSPQNQSYKSEKQFWIKVDKYDHNNSLLTKRELQCAQLLAADGNAKSIAQQFNISHRSVEKYLENIRNKLNCNATSQIVANAVRLGILPITNLLFK